MLFVRQFEPDFAGIEILEWQATREWPPRVADFRLTSLGIPHNEQTSFEQNHHLLER